MGRKKHLKIIHVQICVSMYKVQTKTKSGYSDPYIYEYKYMYMRDVERRYVVCTYQFNCVKLRKKEQL